MKNVIIKFFTILTLLSCKNTQKEYLNLKFTYISNGGSEVLKNQNNTEFEFIKSKIKANRIEISIDKFATGSIPYYGKARVINDTLYLEYWTNIDEKLIPSISTASKFKYEINKVNYKIIKFNFLGNKFKQK